MAFNGAEPVREETIDRFVEAFAPCGFRREAFYPCYGLAEATLIVSGGFKTALPVIRSFDAQSLENNQVVDALPDEEGARSFVGCGGTLLDQEILIVNPDLTTRCAPDEIGEIWVAGPSVAQGYWKQPEATAHTFQARLSDGAGPYLRTGDLGFMQDGELFITGRLKDLIIIRGVNHYPQDIEATVERSHKNLRPGVSAAITVEIDGRERLVIVNEMERVRQRDSDELEEVYDSIRRQVSAEHEIPVEGIALVKAGSIPKTSSGKIQRHACRREFLDGTLDIVGQWRAWDPADKSAAKRRDAKHARPGACQRSLQRQERPIRGRRRPRPPRRGRAAKPRAPRSFRNPR